MSALSKELKKLTKGSYKSIYSNNGVEIRVQRTEKFGPEDFVIEVVDKNKVLQIPHGTLFNDLDAKLKTDSRDATKLFCIIEKINQGDDPAHYTKILSSLTFSSGT